MVTNPAGLKPKKDCTGDAQQQLKTTDPTSRQRGRPTSKSRNCLKMSKKEGIGRRSQMGA
jgi:hypothetical protein